MEKPTSSSRDHLPSFSSSLLDQIYRSIDDSPAAVKKKHHHASLLQDCEISPDKLIHHHHRSVATDFERSRRVTAAASSTTAASFLRYSNSSSSDLSGFSSSSSSDSFYGRRSKSSVNGHSAVAPPPSKEVGGFLRTKSKALKIYSDLKKVKQPISPGGRLATFLNSLFTNAASNHKKPKKVSTEPKSTATTCSSASSFSRSCLSKTPSSSTGKSKRSVRFCPVNVILDEDSSVHIPYDYKTNESKRHRRVMMMEEEEENNRRVIQAAKDLIRTYQKENEHLTMTKTYDDDDDDDAASYSSSDLFELENLSAIGIGRYREELPVYETTRLDNTNRAIATTTTTSLLV